MVRARLAGLWSAADGREHQICRFAVLHGGRHYIRFPMIIASRAGDGWLWGMLLLVALIDPQAGPAAALHMGLTATAGALLYRALKLNLARERPCITYEAMITAGERMLDRYSFPSGHTLHAFCFYVMSLYYLPHLSPLLLPCVAMIALSRVVLGLHYPTDVLAGGLLGAALAKLSLAFMG